MTENDRLRVSVVTLFPELFAPFFATSMVKRAVETSVLTPELVNLRDFGLGKHKNVDDTPYGGGSGMVLRVDPVVAAMEAADEAAEQAGSGKAHRVLLAPTGRPFTQVVAREFAQKPHLTLVCGRYEGFDERCRSFVHDEVSLGDFVMTGGEIAAMAIIEATTRLFGGVLGNEASSESESFSPSLAGGLEYPHYTRPASFRGLEVPEVLAGGNHAAIEAFRSEQSRLRTSERRPDLRQTCAPVTRRPVHVALVHHPVKDKQGQVITTTITNLDVHDIARSVRTFGGGQFFVAHPIAAQRELAARILGHWTEGSGKQRIPDRSPALENVRVVDSLDDAIAALGPDTEVWTTAAIARGGDVREHADLRAELERPGPPVLMVLGTGWGLTDAVLERAHVRVAPIFGNTEYNHLSVRAACAIMLAKLTRG